MSLATLKNDKDTFGDFNSHLEARPSTVHGQGCFTTRAFKKGEMMLICCRDLLISEAAYEDIYNQKTPHDYSDEILQSGVRYVGPWILANRVIGAEDYLNHSDTPNVLYHVGAGFATRDIEAGEELFVDYHLFLPVCETMDFGGGVIIKGLPPKEALKKSLKQLQEIME